MSTISSPTNVPRVLNPLSSETTQSKKCTESHGTLQVLCDRSMPCYDYAQDNGASGLTYTHLHRRSPAVQTSNDEPTEDVSTCISHTINCYHISDPGESSYSPEIPSASLLNCATDASPEHQKKWNKVTICDSDAQRTPCNDDSQKRQKQATNIVMFSTQTSNSCFHAAPRRTVLFTINIFLVLTLLNGCASASKDFHFPDPRQGTFAQGLNSFHISLPTRVDQHGNFVTHSLHAKHDIQLNTRQRRSVVHTLSNSQHSTTFQKDFSELSISNHYSSKEDSKINLLTHKSDESSKPGEYLWDQQQNVFHYKIPLRHDTEVLLELRHTQMLLAPSAVIERRVNRQRNISDSSFKLLGHHAGCHLSGTVAGELGSKAAVSACDGLRGFIQLGDIEYLIEPVKGHNLTQDGGHPHIVYKRSALPDHMDFLSRKKRKEPPCGVQDAYDRALQQRERWERHRRSTMDRQKEDNSHSSTAHSRKRRSISTEKHVETLVVVDPEMVAFYINEDIETYVLTVMNMVASLFHDASIGNAVNIVIVRIMLMQDPDDELKITHHADNTLKSFCKWQKKINFRDDDHPNHHDVAVLLTRRNICSRMNEPCNTLGLAQVAGLCQNHRTCSINEDTGLSLAWTVAHELGHNFGMKHDTHEDCQTEDPDVQFVMAPHLTWDKTPTSWSNCSRTSITEFLDRNWGYCLDDPPGEHDFKYPTLPAGTMYDADHQCRLLYGAGAERCNGIEVLENICVTLWCRVNNKCSTKLQAAATGTICGTNKWCFNSKCVDIGERPQAIDGEWGQWGEWSTCTRTCGAGVSVAQRHCNHPPPSNGGKYCTGERKRYRICNTDSCDEEAKSFRGVQCEEFNSIPYKGSKYEWEPIMTPETPCQLHCKPKGMFFSVLLKDIVTDGTPCVIGSRHMCISGRCRHIGCDWMLDSSATEDRCGVCFGDGSTCTTIIQQYKETKQLGYVEATVIPKGARNIRVEEVKEASNFLALRNDAGEYYLNGHWFIQWSGDYEMAGTVIHYKRTGNKEKFLAPGPLKEPLHIMILIQTHNPGVEFEYTVPKENVSDIREPEFYWDYTAWSHCTVSCGGGTQRQAVVCKEKEAGAVFEEYCDQSKKPDDQLRACNIHLCPARWWSGPWQHCTVTCGDQGVHRRTVICVRSLGQDEQIALEDSVCEGLDKPLEVAPCRHKEPCPTLGYWEMLEWSNCTRLCNGGVQFRKVTCVAGDRCEEPKPPIERACNEQECQTTTPPSLERLDVSEGGHEQDETLVSKPSHYSLSHTDTSNTIRDSSADNTDYTISESMKTENPNVILSSGSDNVKNTNLIKEGSRQTSLYNSDAMRNGENGQSKNDYIDHTIPNKDSTKDGNVLRNESQPNREKAVDDKNNVINSDSGTQPYYEWHSEDWNQCSHKCDKGVQTRQVQCLFGGESVNEELCDARYKPNASKECMLTNCLAWKTSDWSKCSASCGEAVQVREVTCPVPDMCEHHSRPETSKPCDQLPPCTAWVYGDWSKCTKTCGGGRQERLVQCVNLTSQQLAKGCETSQMPVDLQNCNTEACPADVGAALSQSCESNEMSYKVCRMLKRIGLCHKQYVQSKCCRTCADHSRPKPDVKKLS